MQTFKIIDRIFYRELGRQLRKIRECRNMTLKDLAQATGYSGSLIEHWELGLTKMNSQQMDVICNALDVSNNISVSVNIGFLLEE